MPQTWPTYEPQQPVQVDFDNAIQLTGYDLVDNNLTLYWQSVTPINDDVVVFIHLLDSTGNMIIQADAPPTNNAYPTSWWSPGEVIADPHRLPIDSNTAKVHLGLYHLDSGQRLPITASTLPTQDDSLEIEVR